MKKLFPLFVLAASVLLFGVQVDAASANLIANPSLETAAGDRPDKWFPGRWGTNTAVFRYPVAGFQSAKAAQVEIAQYTSGDAKWWFQEVSVNPGQRYRFSNNYLSTATSYVTLQYRVPGGFRYIDLAVLGPTGNWQTNSLEFVVPPDAASLTIFHLIKKVGTLTVDNYSLTQVSPPATNQGIVSITFDDGYKTTYQNALPILRNTGLKSTWYIITGRFTFPAYMTAQQVLDVQAAGHEIGAHTRTHPDLTTLSSTQARDEIAGSLNDLKGIGARNVESFAYPFGAYNAQVENITKSVGFRNARSTNSGYNTVGVDVFALRRQPGDHGVSAAQMKSWIDTAMRDNKWLILVFHRVDTSGTSTATTPQVFQEVMNYLKQKNAHVLTMHDAMNALGI